MRVKKTNYFKSIKLFFLIIGIVIISCNKDDDKLIPVTKNTTKVEAIDRKFFQQLKKSMDKYDENIIWKGYNPSKMPMYYVFLDPSKKALRGYLVNPVNTVKGADKITGEEAEGLDVYKYNKDILKLQNSLNKGNGLFDFFYKIEGAKYYAQVYSEKDINDKKNGAIQLANHEMFHVFQFSDWTSSSTAIQNQKKYPLNKELLSLQLLTKKIAKKMPLEANKDKLLSYLKMYVAIRAKEIKIDPTPEKMVINMANEQENGEGTARYVEIMNSYSLFKDFNESFEIQPSSSIDEKRTLREFFSFIIWYETGAATTYMLKKLGVVIENDIKSGKTLYDIAKDYLRLTNSEKTLVLNKAKSEFKWSDIEKEADRLLSLK